MLDISNKLHALVDEFVSNLSSECDILANNVSAQPLMYVPSVIGPEEAKNSRSSNRTTSEVLNGLKRPSDSMAKDYQPEEGRTNTPRATPDKLEDSKGAQDGERYSRPPKPLRTSRESLEKVDHKQIWDQNLDTDFNTQIFGFSPKAGRSKHAQAAKPNFVHSIEVLSSDHSSDDNLQPLAKKSKEIRGKHSNTKTLTPSSRGRTSRVDTHIESTSPGSSHSLDYGYEEDTISRGTKNRDVSSPIPKLRLPEDLPEDEEDFYEVGGTGEEGESTDAAEINESHRKNRRNVDDEDVSLQEGDDFASEDPGDNRGGSESEGEELPVLPKVLVKRKNLNERKGSEKKTPKGVTKSGSPPTKKQRTPQIDASVVTKLEFGKRPENSVSTPQCRFNLYALLN